MNGIGHFSFLLSAVGRHGSRQSAGKRQSSKSKANGYDLESLSRRNGSPHLLCSKDINPRHLAQAQKNKSISNHSTPTRIIIISALQQKSS